MEFIPLGKTNKIEKLSDVEIKLRESYIKIKSIIESPQVLNSLVSKYKEFIELDSFNNYEVVVNALLFYFIAEPGEPKLNLIEQLNYINGDEFKVLVYHLCKLIETSNSLYNKTILKILFLIENIKLSQESMQTVLKHLLRFYSFYNLFEADYLATFSILLTLVLKELNYVSLEFRKLFILKVMRILIELFPYEESVAFNKNKNRVLFYCN